MNNIATLLARRSDLRGARQAAEESLAIRREIGNKIGIGASLRNLARVSLLQGNLIDGRKQLEEALAIQSESGAKAEAAFTSYTLASVFLADNQAARAEELAREATEELRPRKSDSELNARAVLAEAQLAQGRLSEAKRTIDEAAKPRAIADDPSVHLPVSIMAARVRAASGEYAQAAKSLEAVICRGFKIAPHRR